MRTPLRDLEVFYRCGAIGRFVWASEQLLQNADKFPYAGASDFVFSPATDTDDLIVLVSQLHPLAGSLTQLSCSDFLVTECEAAADIIHQTLFLSKLCHVLFSGTLHYLNDKGPNLVMHITWAFAQKLLDAIDRWQSTGPRSGKVTCLLILLDLLSLPAWNVRFFVSEGVDLLTEALRNRLQLLSSTSLHGSKRSKYSKHLSSGATEDEDDQTVDAVLAIAKASRLLGERPTTSPMDLESQRHSARNHVKKPPQNTRIDVQQALAGIPRHLLNPTASPACFSFFLTAMNRDQTFSEVKTIIRRLQSTQALVEISSRSIVLLLAPHHYCKRIEELIACHGWQSGPLNPKSILKSRSCISTSFRAVYNAIVRGFTQRGVYKILLGTFKDDEVAALRFRELWDMVQTHLVFHYILTVLLKTTSDVAPRGCMADETYPGNIVNCFWQLLDVAPFLSKASPDTVFLEGRLTEEIQEKISFECYLYRACKDDQSTRDENSGCPLKDFIEADVQRRGLIRELEEAQQRREEKLAQTMLKARGSRRNSV